MNDKNKIKSEIERLLNKEWKWGSSIEAKFRCEAYRELLEFIDSLPEDVSEDLNETATKYCNEIEERNLSTLLGIEKGFIRGTQWQKQQMMKDAVDAEVGYGKGFIIPLLGCILDEFGLDYGDKVKLIIVKEG